MARIQQQIAVSVTIQRPELPARDEYMKPQYHTANSVRNFKGNAGTLGQQRYYQEKHPSHISDDNGWRSRVRPNSYLGAAPLGPPRSPITAKPATTRPVAVTFAASAQPLKLSLSQSGLIKLIASAALKMTAERTPEIASTMAGVVRLIAYTSRNEPIPPTAGSPCTIAFVGAVPS
jgi:hypothetical protein